MAISDVTDWIDEFSRPGLTWFVKRLSANDTLATGAHQAGPYIPKSFLFDVLPEIDQPERENPDFNFDLYIDSHPDHRLIRAVWYNSRVRGSGTRNETRLTGFGGTTSALLDPDSTGSLAAFVFRRIDGKPECHVWVCDDATQSDLFEELVGIVEPKHYIIWKPGVEEPQGDLFEEANLANSCWLSAEEIPDNWAATFPTGAEIVQKTFELRPPAGMNPDVRLLRRRDCEFQVFRSIEKVFWHPKISRGFQDLDAFIGVAQSILQSRKSRSGKSLELHTHRIFLEEGFTCDTDFTHSPVLKGNKRPDFVFPNAAAFADPDFPVDRLRMLAAKTSCKDRWRQILNEADQVKIKHLLTLQEGVSKNQFDEMTDAGVRLVVPAGLHRSYPDSIRGHLITLEEFIAECRILQRNR
jgi:hypothetical protein